MYKMKICYGCGVVFRKESEFHNKLHTMTPCSKMTSYCNEKEFNILELYDELSFNDFEYIKRFNN